MPGLVARYTSSRSFAWLALLLVGCASATAWLALRWPPMAIAAGVFLLIAMAFGALALRPAIEIHESHLVVGQTKIPWREIRRVDQVQRRWRAPLAVHLILETETPLLLIHAGDAETGRSLLRHLRRYSTRALLDGIPYRQYWGEDGSETLTPTSTLMPAPTPVAVIEAAAPMERAPLLLPEDEAEVERLFQKLKTAGRLDTPSLPQ